MHTAKHDDIRIGSRGFLREAEGIAQVITDRLNLEALIIMPENHRVQLGFALADALHQLVVRKTSVFERRRKHVSSFDHHPPMIQNEPGTELVRARPDSCYARLRRE